MRTTFNLLISLMIPVLGVTQEAEKSLDLKDVWLSGKFFPETFDGVNHLDEGDHYSKLQTNEESGYQFILKYHYESEQPKDTLFHTRQMGSNDFKIDDYQFSASSRYLLLKTETISIYRHSTKAKFYVYDLQEDRQMQVFDTAHVMYTSFAPNETHVAFVYKNNLYIQDINDGKVTQITNDGKKNKILNGRSDWVYEEEFKLVKAFEWAPDGEKIAFYKFDESRVKQYTIAKYNDVYPKQYTYKYPKAGEKNSILSLHIYHLSDDKTVDVASGDETDIYLPRMKWTNDEDLLSYQKLNRRQNELNLYFVDAETGDRNLIYTEKDDAYISVDDDLTFLNNNQFIWTSTKDGYNHIYLMNNNGEEVRQITNGDWPVTKLLGIDEERGKVYYQSAQPDPMQRQVHRIDFDGNDQKTIADKPGTNAVKFSKTYDYHIWTHNAANEPHKVALHKRGGAKVRQLVENNELESRMEDYNFVDKEFFQFETKDGTNLNGWLMKPTDFDPNEEYPVFITIYGGPGAQTVTDEWGWTNFIYYQMLAQNGYVVVSVDNRGTGGRGEQFQKMTYMNLGKFESIDQVQAAEYLGNQDYIDEERIGIFGWSYGGYLTLLSLARGSDVFKTGVAVAPVTDWHFYDNIYTERYMRKPSENQEGYRESSVLHKIDSIKDNFLLVHGTYDDNVHPQNSMKLIQNLIKSNKQFNSEFYPNKAHSINGGITRYHLFSRITKFLEENLKN